MGLSDAVSFSFRKIIFIIGLNILFLGIHAQQDRLANTLLWKITGNGLSKPSYLYGTMHISNKLAFHLKDSFFTAIEAVDYVATELNPETWLADMFNSRIYTTFNEYTQGNKASSGDFYQQTVNFKPLNPAVLKMALFDNSELVNGLMYRLTEGISTRNYEEGTYVDMYIYQTGKKLNKSIMGIEKFDETIQMLIKSMMPDENADQSGKDYENYSSDNTNNVLENMQNAYRKGNLNELDSLMRLTYHSKNYEKYIITERNKIMFRRMDSIMKIGSLFIGVGAAHLPGKNGIIQLLRDKGYTVTPVLSKESASGIKTRDKLEKKVYNQSLSTYFLADSSVQYAAPSPFISIPTNSENELFLYTDIVNGTYYTIHRLKHSARIFGRTERNIAEKVDSILYETVPGKILTKKTITSNNGYPGISIKSKLTGGDIMQFYLYYTPIEIIIFKASGLEQAINSATWTGFFNSLKFNNRPNKGWNLFKEPNRNFTVQLPVNRIVNYGGKPLKEVSIQAFDPGDSSYYILLSNNLFDYTYLEDDTFELNYLTEQLTDQLSAKLKTRKFCNNNRAIEAVSTVESPINRVVKTKTIIQGGNYYILAAFVRDTALGNTFLQSFKLADNRKTDNNFKLTDSTMFFSTNTDHPDSSQTKDVLELVQKMNLPSYLFRYPGFDEFINNRSKEYISGYQSAAIQVNRQKLDEYFYVPSLDSLWKTQMSSYSSGYGNYVSKAANISHLTTSDTFPSMSFWVRDSLSYRAIWVKKVLANDHIFTLSTVIDTLQGPTPWQENFYKDFRPWDTCHTASIFASKSKPFINDLNSTKDSAKFEKLLNNYYTYNIVEKDTAAGNAVLRFMDSSIFGRLDINKKCKIIKYLTFFKNDRAKCYPVIERLYKDAADTSLMQFQILNVLADHKDSKSMEILSQLMEQNIPLSDETSISELFENISDSLELGKIMMPNALKYLEYPEYKSSILQLFAKLIIDNKLPATLWLPYKKSMLVNAQTELKRYYSEASAISKKDKSAALEYMDDYGTSNIQDVTSKPLWLETEGIANLACYAVGFAQLYSTDLQARQFVDKVMATGNKGLIYTCAIELKRSKQPVSDTIWHWLARDNKSRMYFCDWLEVTKDTSLYPQKYYNQLDMSISWLMAITKDGSADSVNFIKKLLVSNARRSGYLYFFKYKVDDSWKLNYVGFQPKDTSIMLSDFSYYDFNGIPLKNQSATIIDEAIEKACKKVSLAGRRRIKAEKDDYAADLFSEGEF